MRTHLSRSPRRNRPATVLALALALVIQVVVGIATSCATRGVVVEAKKGGRRSPREWSAELSETKLARMLQDEWETDNALNNNAKTQPDMVFAFFGKGLTKLEEQRVAQAWAAKLHAVGVRVQIFEAGADNSWVIAVHKPEDAPVVMEFLKGEPDVMKRRWRDTDAWNLPKFQKEYDAEMRKNSL